MEKIDTEIGPLRAAPNILSSYNQFGKFLNSATVSFIHSKIHLT